MKFYQEVYFKACKSSEKNFQIFSKCPDFSRFPDFQWKLTLLSDFFTKIPNRDINLNLKNTFFHKTQPML